MQAGPLRVWVTGLTCDDIRLYDCLERLPMDAQQIPFLVLVAQVPANLYTEILHRIPLCPVLPQQSACLVQPNMPENRACLQAKRQSHRPTSRAAALCRVGSKLWSRAWPCSQCCREVWLCMAPSPVPCRPSPS